jgi:ABC-type glycerol-3-phosphate transport system substrate-binding protein
MICGSQTAEAMLSMRKPSLETRSELPWLVAALAALLIGWFLYNRNILAIYPPDLSEHGAFQVITYGSDPNPARADQLNKFNQFYRKDGLKVSLVPGGSDGSTLITTSSAGTAPDIVDAYEPEDLRTLVRKGLVRPLNSYLKAAHIDLEAITWPARLDALRQPNPTWKLGDPPLDRYIYYAVPNNMDVPVVFFNASLYEQVKAEHERAGQPMPPQPWLNWTWWDFAALARSLERRSDDGRILSFGATPPKIETVAIEIGLSMRGESREQFDRMSAAERHALGIDGLSWDDCVSVYQRDPAGTMRPFPNRHALTEALQFCYDMVDVLHGSPSSSDLNQMASSTSFGFESGFGQFTSGMMGMHTTGRWFLGQVRATCAFDWRLVRMPRWVPLSEWQGWQQRGLAPNQRDGAWGEREHPLRGFGLPLGGRMSFISSSSRDPARAFKFLEYLTTNQDFNRILLVEDGMGADMHTALDYLATSDPLFPEEVKNRPVEHELGSLANLYARQMWPYTNHLLGREQAYLDMDSAFSQNEWLERAMHESHARIDYAAASRFFTGTPLSCPVVGSVLCDRLVDKFAEGLARGHALDSPPRVQGPSRITLAILTAFAGAIAALGIRMWSGRRDDA